MEPQQIKEIVATLLQASGMATFSLVDVDPEPYDEKGPLDVEHPDILLYVRGGSDVFGLHITSQE